MSAQDELRQAIALIKFGERKAAGRTIIRVLHEEPDNDLAWYWLSVCHQDINKKKQCLQKALTINPNNRAAQRALKELNSPDLSSRVKKFSALQIGSVIGGLLVVLCACCGGSGILFSTYLTKQTARPGEVRIIVTPMPVFAETATTEILQPTLTLEPVITEPPGITIKYPPCIPKNAEVSNGFVINVIDGDTIEVSINNTAYKVRYIGIDTPENTIEKEPFGAEAAQANLDLVGGKTVTLIKDVSETDRYGRLLRYVFVGDVFVNYQLVRRGFARAIEYPPDVACANTFREAENTAKNIALGLWGLQPTTEITIIAPTPGGSVSGNCDPAYPDVCIAPSPPDLDCKDISFRRFKVLPPDPHNFDGDGNGIGCEGE